MSNAPWNVAGRNCDTNASHIRSGIGLLNESARSVGDSGFSPRTQPKLSITPNLHGMKVDVEQQSATDSCRLGLALPCQVREHLVDLRPETEKLMTGLVFPS